jgi:hypothetical protein
VTKRVLGETYTKYLNLHIVKEAEMEEQKMDEQTQVNGQQSYDNPQMMGGQQPYGNPQMMGGQQPYGNPQMMGGQQMYGNPQMMGGQQPYGNPQMMGGQQPYGNPQMMGGQQMYGNPQMQQTAKRQGNGNAIIGKVVGGITGLISTPQDTIKNIVSEGNIAIGGIYIGIQAVVTFALVLLTFLLLGARACGMSSFGCAFYTLFFVIIMDAIIAGSLTLAAGVIFKGNMTFSKAVNVVGIFALYQTVANILAVIFAFIGGLSHKHFFMSVAFILFVGLTLVALIFGVVAALEACELDANIKIYTIGMALVIAIIGGVVVDNIGGKLCEDSGVSAENVYGMMNSTSYIKNMSDDMHDRYKDYYEDEYDSYHEFLKEYYD